jgi:hypothetical protein
VRFAVEHLHLVNVGDHQVVSTPANQDGCVEFRRPGPIRGDPLHSTQEADERAAEGVADIHWMQDRPARPPGT